MTPQFFDFSLAMRRLCEDICHRHAAFQHIRMEEVAVTWAQTRRPVEWGLQAKLTPMRFEGGATVIRRRGNRLWTVQRVYNEGREMLYILTFYLPRFLNLSFEEKLITVFHELYHISPAFDGDIRRFSGSCYVHTGSQKAYDRQMSLFAREYLSMNPPAQLRNFLRYSFSELQATHGTVMGIRIAIPRLIRIDETGAVREAG
ncbi:MAG: putative metallopeptidase [Planctomyces sp.]